jgi:hypothetical protein
VQQKMKRGRKKGLNKYIKPFPDRKKKEKQNMEET